MQSLPQTLNPHKHLGPPLQGGRGVGSPRTPSQDASGPADARGGVASHLRPASNSFCFRGERENTGCVCVSASYLLVVTAHLTPPRGTS